MIISSLQKIGSKSSAIWILMIWATTSCTWDEIVPIDPCPARPTSELRAFYSEINPNKINSTFWNCVEYLEVTVENQVIQQVTNEDGILNTSNTYDGVTQFNNGYDPQLVLRAAYDDQNIYILASWNDSSFNVSDLNWYYNGESDPLKQDDPLGWTRQQSDDNFMISFANGQNVNDVWNWSIALSEPMGIALDMTENQGSLTMDAGTPPYLDNELDETNRSGPKYEWDESLDQQVTHPLGDVNFLDPGFYLSNYKSFTPDVVNGQTIFENKCVRCHNAGDGLIEFFKVPGVYPRQSYTELRTKAAGSGHDGNTDFIQLQETDRVDVINRIRAFGGFPGHILQAPNGSVADVQTDSNVGLARIDAKKENKGYKVLFVRKLNTGNNDDIVFDPNAGPYNFSVFLSDGDAINKIGKLDLQLVFK